jgi:hypothetical protein
VHLDFVSLRKVDLVTLHTWRFSRPSLPGASKASENPGASAASKSRSATSSGKALAATALTTRKRVETRAKICDNQSVRIMHE